MNPEDNLNGVPTQEQPKSPTPASPPVAPAPTPPASQPPVAQAPVTPPDDVALPDSQTNKSPQDQMQPGQPSTVTSPNFGATPQQAPETFTSTNQQQKNKPPLFMRLLVVLLILGVILGVAVAAYIFIPKL